MNCAVQNDAAETVFSTGLFVSSFDAFRWAGRYPSQDRKISERNPLRPTIGQRWQDAFWQIVPSIARQNVSGCPMKGTPPDGSIHLADWSAICGSWCVWGLERARSVLIQIVAHDEITTKIFRRGQGNRGSPRRAGPFYYR